MNDPKTETLKIITAILVTLDEVGGRSPCSPIYCALGMDINRFSLIKAILIESDLIRIPSADQIELTPKGRETAAQVRAALANIPA
jgi:predicted transcriptional regulator